MKIVNIIVDLLISVGFTSLGVWFLLHGHSMAGGWTLAVGLLVGAYATNTGIQK